MSEEQNARIERQVRFGRIIIGGAVIGAIVGLIITLVRPVPEEALYEMRQIAGFMLVLGAVLGMAAGAFFALLLNLMVKKKHGVATIRHEVVHENVDPEV